MCKLILPTHGKCEHQEKAKMRACDRGFNETTKCCNANKPIKSSVSYDGLPELCYSCAKKGIRARHDTLIALWSQNQDELQGKRLETESCVRELERLENAKEAELGALRKKFEERGLFIEEGWEMVEKIDAV